jgi:hypothetical protein
MVATAGVGARVLEGAGEVAGGAGVGVVVGGVDSAVGVGSGVLGAGLGSVDAVGDGAPAGSFRAWTMMRMRTSPTTSGTTMARMLM